jgi:hypothetical protein
MENLQERLYEFAELMQKQAKALKILQEELLKQTLTHKELIKDIQESVKRLPKSVLYLSKYGWYPTLQMTPGETNLLGDKADMMDINYIDEFMVDHIQEQEDFILKLLIERYPEREKILMTGFKCHDKKDYFASIPIFLSQADGICSKITELKLYNKKNKKPEVSQFVEQLEQGSITSILLQPLTQITSINSDTKNANYHNGLLNRHEVFHGNSLDYGTKTNSCKAISLLYFVGEILWHANDIEKNKHKNLNRTKA